MKLKLLLGVISTVALASADAALITINNGGGNTASGIQTTEGNTFRGGTTPGAALGGTSGGISAGAGVVAFGIFSSTGFGSVTSSNTLAGMFTAFGNVGAFSAGGPTGNRSNFSLAQSATVAGSVFAGQTAYLFVGNGSTFANSTEFLIVNTGIEFNSVSDATPTPTTFTVRPENSSVAWGTTVGNVLTANTDSSVTQGWQMAALVPEPSAALLGLIGVVGLLRRRR